MDESVVSQRTDDSLIKGSQPIATETKGSSSVFKRICPRIFPCVGLVVIFIIVSGIWLYSHWKQSGITTLSSKSEVNVVKQQLPREMSWILKKNTPTGAKTVLTFPNTENQIARWGDYLIYGSGDYSSNVQVDSYNLITGEIKSVYDQGSRSDFQSGRNNRYVSDMQVLDGSLFFSIGGYMTSGATFWMATSSGQLQKLAGGANGRVKYMDDRYWLISGEGDACWSSIDYSLINMSTKGITEVASSVSGCMEGYEYVGVDKRNRMILAFHSPGAGDGGSDSNGIYQYVIARPLNNPQKKIDVITKQEMPKEITSISYSLDTDQLILSGESNYSYDFPTRKISKIENPPDTPLDKGSHGKTFKDKINELSLPQDYQFVLE